MRKYHLALFLLIVLVCAPAKAGLLTITLNSPTLTGSPGDVLEFSGTLTNTTGADLFLNADNFNVAGFDPSAIDDNAFFANAPLFLAAHGSTGDIALFNITIPGLFATGGYSGTFQVLGGVDGDGQDIIGSADFTVDVQQPASVPEPSSLSLVVFPLALAAAFGRWRRRPSFRG